ncbi:hypothetical protein [Haloglomus halophilum]|uniref:hypothetical protein n=1 Tax=Haloglomus halophilum TaxID=2962672 RepID=UPI0020C94157|nr:hypothetical protein [Haloglomus halophilum]
MATTAQTEAGGGTEWPLRYLLLSVGVSVIVFTIKFVGYTVGGPAFLLTSWLAVGLLVVVTGALAAGNSKADGSVLLSILVAFLPVAVEREFDIVFGIGHPNPGVLYGVALALAVAVPVGIMGHIIGQRL